MTEKQGVKYFLFTHGMTRYVKNPEFLKSTKNMVNIRF